MENVYQFIKELFIQNFRAYKRSEGIIKDFDDSKEAEFGFYFFVLRKLHNLSYKEVENSIIDYEFCTRVLDIKNSDFGVDAIVIDCIKKVVYLYNFKYSDNPAKKLNFEQNAASDSMNFARSVKNIYSGTGQYSQNSKDLRTNTIQKRLVDLLSLKEGVFSFELVMVSNVPNKTPDCIVYRNIKLEGFINEVREFSAVDIYDLINKDKNSINGKILLEKDRYNIATWGNGGGRESYIIDLKLKDIIRLTCMNQVAREDSSFDYSQITDLEMNENVISSNVRGFLQNTKFNKNILATLENNLESFFVFNNGITIVPLEAEKTSPRGFTFDLSLKGIQVVNGGQTLKTLYFFAKNHANDWWTRFGDTRILVRVIPTGNDLEVVSKIAQYTNSQNPISQEDLKSLDIVQIHLEEFFATNHVWYKRKKGDYRVPPENCPDKIDITKLAQVLYSAYGHPEEVTKNKKRLFTDYYDSVFKSNEGFISEAYEIYSDFISINLEIKENQFAVSDQKIYYLIYLKRNFNDIDFELNSALEVLERSISQFKSETTLTQGKKMLRVEFREFLSAEYRKLQ